jgi:hypothetical protein
MVHKAHAVGLNVPVAGSAGCICMQCQIMHVFGIEHAVYTLVWCILTHSDCAVCRRSNTAFAEQRMLYLPSDTLYAYKVQHWVLGHICVTHRLLHAVSWEVSDTGAYMATHAFEPTSSCLVLVHKQPACCLQHASGIHILVSTPAGLGRPSCIGCISLVLSMGFLGLRGCCLNSMPILFS